MSKRFKEYLDRFCETYKLESEAAEKHLVVQEVKKYYEEEDKYILND